MGVMLHKVEHIVIVYWISELCIANQNDDWNVVQFSAWYERFFESTSELDRLTKARHVYL
jgi:hypothetical protein